MTAPMHDEVGLLAALARRREMERLIVRICERKEPASPLIHRLAELRKMQ